MSNWHFYAAAQYERLEKRVVALEAAKSAEPDVAKKEQARSADLERRLEELLTAISGGPIVLNQEMSLERLAELCRAAERWRFFEASLMKNLVQVIKEQADAAIRRKACRHDAPVVEEQPLPNQALNVAERAETSREPNDMPFFDNLPGGAFKPRPPEPPTCPQCGDAKYVSERGEEWVCRSFRCTAYHWPKEPIL